MPTNEARRGCCGDCKHSTKEGLSKHYRQWLIKCLIAEEHVSRARTAMERCKDFPPSVSWPQESLLDDSIPYECTYWEKRC